MNIAHFQADLGSFRRIMSAAEPEKRPAAFGLLCKEAIRLHTVGGAPKADVVDEMLNIGLASGLADHMIEAAIADAIDHPFDPNAVKAGVSPKPEPTPNRSASLMIRRMAEITPEPIEWLWPQRIAIGKLTLIAGEPGLGKSQLTCALAASVTASIGWPRNEGMPKQGSVVFLSAEDDASDTVRPRLDAAGADAERVYIVSAVAEADGKGRRSFNLQADLQLLESEIKRIGDVRLVIIDPVSSYLGKVDSHKNAELRAVLEPLGDLASRLRVAMVAITHLSKGAAGNANNQIIGSIAFVAAARAAYIVCRDPDDAERRLFLASKNNLGPDSGGLGFRIGTQLTGSGIAAPAVFWDDIAVTMTASDALYAVTGGDRASPARDEAAGFLRRLLAEGEPVPVADVQKEAKAAGLSWATVRRAKDEIGAKALKAGLGGGWCWELPQDAQEAA